MRGLKNAHPPSILALGFFDGIHRGHQKVIGAGYHLSRQRHIPFQIITFYPHPRNFISSQKKLKYITTYQEKYCLFQKWYPGSEMCFLRFQNALRHTDPEIFLHSIQEAFHPVAIFTGENFRFGFRGQGDTQLLRHFFDQQGVETFIFPSVHQDNRMISSTLIRKQLENGAIELANSFLGYSFCIRGKVVRGNKIGRNLGFPTANIYPSSRKLLPPYGVYFGTGRINQTFFPALIYTGTKPTVEQDSRRIVEVHLPERKNIIVGSIGTDE
ncbi:MAG: hypothetical protein NTX88_08305 [Candidatus Atribacteria bacterium]|nr:hypothetical protein [Candidatus Atribacteria bacterium]